MDERDSKAREIINVLCGTLRELAGGPVSQKWRKWIDAELGPKARRGTKQNPIVAERNARWARAMLDADIAREQGLDLRGPTEVAEALAEEESKRGRQTFTSADVFKVASPTSDWHTGAVVAVLLARLAESDARRAAVRGETAKRELTGGIVKKTRK